MHRFVRRNRILDRMLPLRRPGSAGESVRLG